MSARGVRNRTVGVCVDGCGATMPDVDTTKIRANIAEWDHDDYYSDVIVALCDAIDGARAEIATTDREVFAQIARAEAAEARVGAALVLANHSCGYRNCCTEGVEDIKAALNGGTECP